MFQDMDTFMSQSMDAFQDLMEAQTRMLQDVIEHQMGCTRNCIEALLQQQQDLRQCRSPRELLELQQEYTRKLEETLRLTGEQNVEAMNRAQDALQRFSQGTFDMFKVSKPN